MRVRFENNSWYSLESSEPYGRTPPVFTYIPLSQCKLQVMCCRERLHVTSFGKKMQAFLLSELQIAPKCCILKAFPGILVWSDSWFLQVARGFSIQFSSSIGFTLVNNIACLPLLRLVPSGFNPFLITEFISFTFATWWMYSVNPLGNSTLSCNSGSIALSPERP